MRWNGNTASVRGPLDHLSLGVILACLCALPLRAEGETAAEFYQGKHVILLIASGAGGGYDVYARLFARYAGRYLPGKASFIPKNLPGAGGLTAVSTLYNDPDKDGLTIAALTNGAAMDPLFGNPGAHFDALKLNWLGSIGKLENVCATWHDSPIKTIADARVRDVIVGAAGATSNTAIVPKILNALIATRFKVVGGYDEGSGLTMSLESGEVEGICGLSWSTMKASRPDWIRDKKLNVILQTGRQKLPELQDVPGALDLVADSESRKVLELILIRQEMGRPFAAPPGIPADRLEALRQAFEATMRDPDFRAEAAKLRLEIDPLSHAQIETLLASAYGAPQPIVARAASLVLPAGDRPEEDSGRQQR